MSSKRMSSQRSMPMDIVENILLRLPVKPLLRFKLVSPQWYSLITSQSFIKLHLQRANSLEFDGANNDRLHMIYFSASQNTRKGETELDTVDLSSIVNEQKNDNLMLEHLPIGSYDSEYVVPGGSCNGIVCLANLDGWSFTLLNPSTRTHLNLPSLLEYESADTELLFTEIGKCVSLGLGYDSIADDYKFVKIVLFRGYNTKISVYSCRNKKWNIYWGNNECDTYRDNIYRITESWPYSTGTPCNNALHWLANRREDGQPVVVSFDLHIIKFYRDAMPLPLDYAKHSSTYNFTAEHLTDFKGYLHFIAIKSLDMIQCELDLWMMKDNCRVEESWSKVARINLPFYYYGKVMMCSARQILLHLQGGCTGELILADLATGKHRAGLKPFRVNAFRTAHAYVESLVTLNVDDQHRIERKAPR